MGLACIVYVMAGCAEDTTPTFSNNEEASLAPLVQTIDALPLYPLKNQAPSPDWKSGLWVINLWASWCGPCRKEMPDLERLHIRADGALQVAGISVDDSRQAAAEFLFRYPVAFDNYWDASQRVEPLLDVNVLPTTLIVLDGRIVERITGTRPWGEDGMLRALLAFRQGAQTNEP